MARLDRGRADLALLRDPNGTRVVIPSLFAMATPWRQEKVFVRFDGDTFPTAFHGEGQETTFPLGCLYPRARHADLAALLHLLQVLAPASPDPRLLLRTHAGLAPGLNPAVAVEVDGDVTPVWTAPAVTVQFTVRVVEHSFTA